MSASELITGHCLCGNVSYTINGSHNATAICHCDDCRRSSGTAYSIVIAVPRASITLKGDYKEYLTNTPSGKPAHRIFCPNCGSQIANFPDSNKDIAFIKAGTLSDDIQKTLKPDFEVSAVAVNTTYSQLLKLLEPFLRSLPASVCPTFKTALACNVNSDLPNQRCRNHFARASDLDSGSSEG